jgi:microcin C transport system permease protein
MFINFVFINFAPGGPVEQMMMKYDDQQSGDALSRLSGNGKKEIIGAPDRDSTYKGSRGMDEKLIADLNKQFGFDKPWYVRFGSMVKNYLMFDFGESFYQNRSVIDLILEKLPVSITLGIFSTLLIYLVSIPLGIKKALKNGSKFDNYTSYFVVSAYAIPGFLFAILMVILFAGGSFFSIFPLRGLVSDNFESLSWAGKIFDYLHHIFLPVICMSLGGFAMLTIFTKNSFLEEIGKQYVTTAKAKGLSNKQVLYGHIFRNAMLIIIAGFPAMLIKILFTGSVLIEVIFSLDGIGLLGFNAVMTRDYPVIFATLYLFSLLGLLLNIVTDVTYHLIDPRITFEKRSI